MERNASFSNPAGVKPTLYIFYSPSDKYPSTTLSMDLKNRTTSTYLVDIENESLVRLLSPDMLRSVDSSFYTVLVSIALVSSPKFQPLLALCRKLFQAQKSSLRRVSGGRGLFLRPDAANAQSKQGLHLLRSALGYPNMFELPIGDPPYGQDVLVSIGGHLSGPMQTPHRAGTERASGEEYFLVTGIFDPTQPATRIYGQLSEQIANGRIDQKYLYWDVRAALRWQDISDGTTYLTNPRTLNFLVERAGDIVRSFLQHEGGREKLDVSFINLGVGTGAKDSILLRALLQEERVRQVSYFAIDDSFPMIQVTIPNILDGFFQLQPEERKRANLHYVVTNFEQLEERRFMAYLRDIEAAEARASPGDVSRTTPKRVRFISFLGGSLGNFEERSILGTIRRSLLQGPSDVLLLGLEFVGGRPIEELKLNYSDKPMKDFLFGPIHDVKGEPTPYDKISTIVVPDEGRPRVYSSVPGAKTVVGRVLYGGAPVELFYSSKYEPASIESFLEAKEMRMKIVDRFYSVPEPPMVGKFLLRNLDAGG